MDAFAEYAPVATAFLCAVCYIAAATFALVNPANGITPMDCGRMYCTRLVRTPDLAFAYLALGWPAHDYKLLVRLDTVVRDGDRPIRIWNMRVFESKTLECHRPSARAGVSQLGMQDMTVCTDVAVLRASAAHSPVAPLNKRVEMHFEVVPAAAMPVASGMGFDGELYLTREAMSVVTQSSICISSCSETRQEYTTRVSTEPAVRTDWSADEILVGDVQSLCRDTTSSVLCTQPVVGCSPGSAVRIFPVEALQERMWLQTTYGQAERLYGRNDALLDRMRVRAERSLSCSVDTGDNTTEELLRMQCAASVCDRSFSSVPIRRLAQHVLQVASVPNSTAFHIAGVRSEALSMLPGVEGAGEAERIAFLQTLLVFLVTCTVYLHADNRYSTGVSLWQKTNEHVDSGDAQYATTTETHKHFTTWMFIFCCSVLLAFSSLALLSQQHTHFEWAYSTGALSAIGFLLLPVVDKDLCQLYLGRFTACQWYDAIFGLGCVVARMWVNQNRHTALVADGYDRVVSWDSVATICSLTHWFVRHSVIVWGCQNANYKADASTLGGTNAIADGICAMVLSFSRPPITAGGGSFDAVARMMAVVLGILILQPRFYWACAASVRQATNGAATATPVDTFLILLATLSVIHFIVQQTVIVFLTVDLFVGPTSLAWMRGTPGDTRLLASLLFCSLTTLGSSRLLRQAKDSFECAVHTPKT
tara:strand:+ start:985 stop:3099 length:2115 start_codon:yes stop_codon:yes gene_type:complete